MRTLAAIVLLLGSLALRADERLWIAAKVNGQPATFMFDTGAYDNCLFPDGVRHLGFTNHPDATLTEECSLALGDARCRVKFEILKTPAFISGMTGVIGWPLLSSNILLFDAVTGRIQPLPSLPDDIASWTKIPLLPRFPILALGLKDPRGVVLVDTGNPEGVEVPRAGWERWHDHHRHDPITLNSSFNPTAGFSVARITWAKDFILGPLRLTEVPLGESGPWDLDVGGASYLATLGKTALERLDFIVDGPAGFAYVRTKTTPPLPYDHNRVGATFAPLEGLSGPLVARVLKDGPAFRAGARDGDVLLKEDGRDMTHWQTETNHPGFKAPGVKVEWSLARGSKTFNATVVCEQALGPPYEDPKRRPRVTNDFLNTAAPLRLTPTDARHYFDLGLELFQGRDFTHACESFKEAIRLQSTNKQAFLYCGTCENRLGQFFSASLHLTEFLKIETNSAEAYAERAFAYSSSSDNTNAVLDYSEAIQLKPNTAEYFRSRGACYSKEKDLKHAADDYRKAVSLDPKDAPSLVALSFIETSSSDSALYSPSGAEADSIKACELTHWTNSDIISVLAFACAKANDFDRAIKYEKKYLSVGDHTPEDRTESKKRLAAYQSRQIYYTGQ